MRILTTGQMREADRFTIEEIGIPSLVLMENAGRQVVAALERAFPDLHSRRVAVLAGRGNNGGDGLVVARTLRNRGVDVRVFLAGTRESMRGDARANLDVLGKLGLSVAEIAEPEQWRTHAPAVEACSLIVDSLFGTGLGAPLSGVFEAIVTDVNRMGIPVVSVDLPSGMSGDTHRLIGPCIRATLTVTLAAPKLPLALTPACLLAGEMVVADIGIPKEVIDGVPGPRVDLLTKAEVRAVLPARRADAHKGDFGHVLIVAGSRGKTGAAHLAAVGALRSGAGLVTVGTPAGSLPTVASLGAEYMTMALAETEDGALSADAIEAVRACPHDVLAVGPGIGTGDGARRVVRAAVERARVPLVLDADAINAFAGEPDRLTAREGQQIVITPHPGELSRLLGVTTDEVQADRLERARAFAVSHRVYVVLKGHRTVVAAPDGRTFVNATGNPGMATGGTGDVLTGMLAAWLGQVQDPALACALAVHLHGAAGDLAAHAVGPVSMTAGDLVARIGDALRDLATPLPGADRR